MSDTNGNGAESKDLVITITMRPEDLELRINLHNCNPDVALMLLERATRNIEHSWRVQQTQAAMQAQLDQARARAVAQDVMRRH